MKNNTLGPDGTTMAGPFGRLLRWTARILGLLVALFVGMFALDTFHPGTPVSEALFDFAVHLIPVFALLALVGASWRREWIGALTFIGLAVSYAFVARNHLSWMLLISGPLAVVGSLFWWSWVRGDRPKKGSARSV